MAIKYLMLFVLWVIVPPGFFFVSKPTISKTWVRLVITLLSPILIVLYLIIYFIAYFLIMDGRPVTYEELQFKTHEDIACITEIDDFPKFKYVTNSHSLWDGSTIAWFEFDEALTDGQKKLFAEKCSDINNACWRNNGDTCWVFERGWDLYSCKSAKVPECTTDSASQIRIYVDRKGFSLKTDRLGPTTKTEDFPDITFPKHQVVNQLYFDIGPDLHAKTTLLLDKNPSPAFYKDWEYDSENDMYVYKYLEKDDWKHVWKIVCWRKNSRIVILDYSTY